MSALDKIEPRVGDALIENRLALTHHLDADLLEDVEEVLLFVFGIAQEAPHQAGKLDQPYRCPEVLLDRGLVLDQFTNAVGRRIEHHHAVVGGDDLVIPVGVLEQRHLAERRA